MNGINVVTGAGPVGWTVAQQLADAGESVRVLTRSASGPEHPLVERMRVDVNDPATLRKAISDAKAVFHCIHGSKYSAKAWAAELPRAEQTVLAAAGEVGTVVVFPESLYSYSTPEHPMSETSPRSANGGKRGIRTQLLAARAESGTPTVSVVASDFFGPQVLNAHAGARMVPRIMAGKSVSVAGNAGLPHSFTYIGDLAAAMIKAALTPDLWNSVVHAPTNQAQSQRELTAHFAKAAGIPSPSVHTVPGWVVRTSGLVSADMRELTETLYQFEDPFVMDSSASERLLEMAPTPWEIAAADTVSWWRGRH